MRQTTHKQANSSLMFSSVFIAARANWSVLYCYRELRVRKTRKKERQMGTSGNVETVRNVMKERGREEERTKDLFKDEEERGQQTRDVGQLLDWKW